jgi:menaquinone-specific isochorismate synthase
VSDAEWLRAASQARSAVGDGIVEKVVLARDAVVEGDAAFDPQLVVNYLARRYPECFTYLFDGLVGSSPELLVRTRGEMVESVVLGGSAARGMTERDDNELAQRLLTSAKDRIEHDLALATVRDALHDVCESLSIENEPSLLRLPYVQHLRTHVSGRLAHSRDSVELAGVLHPTAAVCGVPVDKALAAIRELEGMKRGRFCGPVGWTDASGDGEWAIALRCARLQGTRARIFAGAGIVADSDPASELAETELKLRPLLEALGADAGRPRPDRRRDAGRPRPDRRRDAGRPLPDRRRD